ncbi:MAG: tetratricopeptide repeat protein [Planctomycetia bacterium]|nr:tetratricopeptide repeat protein [Planctomycetia bacterium]
MRKTFLLLLLACSLLLVVLVVRDYQFRTAVKQQRADSSASEEQKRDIILENALAKGEEPATGPGSPALALDLSKLQPAPHTDATGPHASDASPASSLGDPELLKGIDAYMNGQPDQAYDLFEEAHRANRHLAPGGVLLALLFSNSGKYESMRLYLEKAVKEHPNDPEAFFQLAGISLNAGRLVETQLLLAHGVELLNQMITNWHEAGYKPETDYRIAWLAGEVLALSAGLEEKQGELPKAESTLRKLTDLAPGRDDAWLSLGYVLMRQQKRDEAQSAFDKAHLLDGNNLSAWLLMALLLEDEEQREDAKKYVPDPVETTSFSDKEIDALVRLYIKWSEMQQADRLADDYHKAHMNSATGWALLGELALYRHEYEHAETAFRSALLADAQCQAARTGLIWALIDQGNKVKLKEGYNLAYAEWQRDPDDAEATVPYAWTLYLMGRQEESEALFAPLLESHQVSPGTAYYLAEIAYAKGNLGLAVNFLDLALNQDTNFPKREAAEELRKLIAEKLEAEQANDNP